MDVREGPERAAQPEFEVRVLRRLDAGDAEFDQGSGEDGGRLSESHLPGEVARPFIEVEGAGGSGGSAGRGEMSAPPNLRQDAGPGHREQVALVLALPGPQPERLPSPAPTPHGAS